MTRPKSGVAVNDPEQEKAWREQRAIREKLAASESGAIRRAVSDVMDGTLPVSHSSRAHGVSNEALRAALAVAGYVPPRRRPVPTTARRRTFGSGKRRGT